MKFLHSLLLLAFCFFALAANAQNLFAKKLDNCTTDRFCLDCGDQKGNVNKDKFFTLLGEQNKTGTFKGLSGKVKFQVLIDSLASGCVLSHTDTAEHPATKQLVVALNNFDGWIPAITEGKTERKTSINIIFSINNGQLSGMVERVDMDAFQMSFETPSPPQIDNTEYEYKNKNLDKYAITAWNSKNSNLGDNSNYYVATDNKDRLWVTSDKGIFILENGDFRNTGSLPGTVKDPGYFALAIDNNDTAWTFSHKGIYSYSDGAWKKHEPENVFGVDGGYFIKNIKTTGEIFFGSDEGLTIYKDGTWSNLNMNNLKGLPSNRVCYADRDSKGRLWIGTFSGSVMINEKGTMTRFDDGDTPLKGQTITSMDEDGKGRFFFGLFQYDWEKENNIEGIAILNPNGKWEHHHVKNSGMPYDHSNGIVYDRKEKILWISTEKSGLVRYDLNGNWEHYHSDNSSLPTSAIRDITRDSKGNIYLGTQNGTAKISRK